MTRLPYCSATNQVDHAEQDHDRGRDRQAQVRELAPQLVELGQLAQAVLALVLEVAQLAERQQHRQQDQVGEDRQRNADRGRDGQFEDDAHRDDQDRGEADAAGHQRDGARNQQRLETALGRDQRAARQTWRARATAATEPCSSPPKKISPRKRLIICSPWLTAIAKIRNGVSMFIGSMPKPSRCSAPSIQTTATSAAGDGQRCQLDRHRIQEQQQPGQRHRDEEEQHHRLGAVADVADHLGEADDRDGRLFVLVLGADRVELAGDLVVVDLDAARRILGHQVDPDHRAGKILGDEAADDVRLVDVGLDRRELLRRGLETFDVRRVVLRDDVAAGEAVLDDFDEAHVRREDRTDARGIDAVDRLGVAG